VVVHLTDLTGLAQAAGAVVVLATGQEGKEKGYREWEGRGDDCYILGFVKKFTGCELWPAEGAIAVRGKSRGGG
jgi:hypothetical protein